MLKKGFLKPEISIGKLGSSQFWFGIIIGMLMAFVLSYFFNYARESLRVTTIMVDLYILPETEFRLYDLFYASLATSLGFGFTIVYWLSSSNRKIRKRYLKTLAISNAWLITYVVLMSVARFGPILTLMVYGIPGYEGHLDLLNDFWLMLILIPVYVFFAHWNSIRMIFRAGYWVLFSVVFHVLTTFCLYKITYVDRAILNQKYYDQNKQRFEYIDSEFDKAKKLNVFFSDTTKQILRKHFAQRTTNLVLNLKNAFHSDKIVPIDSLILQKIVIHNMNRHEPYFYFSRQNKDNNWSYALPENIYEQILKHDPDSKETEILFEILMEQVSLFIDEPVVAFEEEDGRYTEYDNKKSSYRAALLYGTETIQSRLIQVVDTLKSDKRYKKYHHLLQDITFGVSGKQKYYELNLEGTGSRKL